jgi:hypothetical protein
LRVLGQRGERAAGEGKQARGKREAGLGQTQGAVSFFFLFIFFCFKAISKTSLKNHFKISLTYL